MLFVNLSQAPLIITIILLLIGIIFFILFKQKKLREYFFCLEQRKLLSKNNIKGVKTTKTVCLIITVIMIGLALLDPRGSSLSSDIELEGMDIVFVYDISRSMDVQDVTPSRLELAKSLGEQLVDALTGNRIGLVAFAADAIRLLPLTTDISTVELFIRELSSDMISSQSTDIGKALNEALKNFAEDTLTHKAIILFSDGENLDGNLDSVLDKLKEKGISVFIIGMGTTTGGTIPIVDRRSGQTFTMKDLLGKEIISKADPPYLQELTQQTSGEYVEGSRGSLEKIITLIENIEKSPFGSNTQSFLEPKFRFFIMIALLALLLYLFLPEKKFIKLSLLILFLSQAVPGYSLTADRKAYQSYQNGEYSTALRFFQRSLAKNPNNDKTKLGEGSTLYKLERSDRAEKSFLALTNSENPTIAKQAVFNAGNAKVQGEDLDGALEIYKEVMKNNPVDSRLYKKALNNYIYTRALQQQQQQQQQNQDQEGQENQQGQENQDNQSQDNKEQQSQTQNQENPQQQEQDPQKGQEQEQDNTPSQSVSPSDIDNLLGIAQEEEKENFEKQHKKQKGILQQNKY